MVRYALVALGFLLLASTPIVGPIPGPGGIFVFAGGLSLILKYTGWAKRLYVRFKRKHPKKGQWSDWSLRRASARRRHERDKLRAEIAGTDGDVALPSRVESAAPDLAGGAPAAARANGAGKMDRSD